MRTILIFAMVLLSASRATAQTDVSPARGRWSAGASLIFDFDWTGSTGQSVNNPPIVEVTRRPRIGGALAGGRRLGPRSSVQAELDLPRARAVVIHTASGLFASRKTDGSRFLGAMFGFTPQSFARAAVTFYAGGGAIRHGSSAQFEDTGPVTDTHRWVGTIRVGAGGAWSIRKALQLTADIRLMMPSGLADEGRVILRPACGLRVRL